MSSKKTNLKWTSWLILSTFFAQYAAIAATPSQRDQVRADIQAEFEKRYEQDTPGVGQPSVGDKLLASSSKAIKDDVVNMLTDLKMGVLNGANLAMNGNNSFVVIGAKDGWKLFKQYGEAAGLHYVDSVYLLPKKAVTIGKGFAQAGKNIGQIASSEGQSTGQAWSNAAGAIKNDAQDLAGMAGDLNRFAGNTTTAIGQDAAASISSEAQDAVNWSKDVIEWTKSSTKNAFVDLTKGTIDNARMTGRWTEAVGKFWVDSTVDAAASVNDWTKATWDWTLTTTDNAWELTKNSGADVGKWTLDSTGDAGKWLAKNATAPAQQALHATEAVSNWNWKTGYSQGLKDGFNTGRSAWDHDDKLMATLWTLAGVGEAGVHILLLEPTIVPVLASYGVAGTVALSTVGYPSVGAFFLGGMATTAATYTTGTALTGAVALGGSAATLLAGGGGILRTGATAGVGTAATAATVVGGVAYTAGAAGVNALRTVGTPLVGAVGALGAAGAGGLEIAGSALWAGTKEAGVTALVAGGYAAISSYEAARMTFSALEAAGATVFDDAIVTPIGVVANLAQALGTGAWTLAEDPIYGTLDVLGAGGIAIGTIATSTGAFSYELVKGLVLGLADGIEAVGQSGIWIVGAIAKGVEFIGAAFDLAQHKEWADFRKSEVEDVLETIKKEADAALTSRFGDVILVRVHWWGDEKGHVAFFLTKNKTTGERWFFERIVDKSTCQVNYKVTNQDPVVRAFTQKAWTGVYQSGLFDKVCNPASPGNK